MILSGSKLYGYNYIGTPSLQTIGQQIFAYDYRFGVGTINDGTYNRVQSISDLSNNAITLTAPNPQSRPILDTNGIIGLTGSTRYLQAPFKTVMNKLHLGNAFLSYAVAWHNNPGNTNVGTLSFYRTQGSAKAGQRLGIVTSNDTLNSAVFNDAGTNLGGQTRTTVEDSTFRLYMTVYYGSGGSNNRKTSIAADQTTATFNPTFGTGNCEALRAFEIASGGAAMIKIKTIGAYDLSGKSVAEVDAFVTLFLNTLKSDSEYSGLTTP